MMKRVLSFLATSAVLFASVAATAADRLVIAYEDKQQFPNYLGNSTEIDPQKPGLHVELVQLTAKELGIELELVRLPWNRALASLQKGEVDGVFSGSFKEDRLEIGAYPMTGGQLDESRQIGTTSYSLYRVKGSSANWDGRAFSGLNGPIGAPAGYSIVDDLKKLGATVDESASTTQDLRKLSAGRIAAVAAQGVTADQLLLRPEFANIERVEPPIVTKAYFLLLSHQLVARDPALADRIWETLARLRETRTDEIAARYAD